MNLQIYHETAQILGGFRQAGPAPRISIAPWETASTVLDLAAGIAVFLAAVSLLRSRSRRRLFAGVVVVSAALMTLVLTLPALTRSGTGEPGRPAPEAAAVFLGIALCVAFATVWAEILTNSDRGADSPDAAERFERRFSPIAIRIALWLAVAAGLLLCGVTSATIAAGLVSLLLLALSSRRRRSDFARRAAAVVILVFVLGSSLAARPHPDDGGRAASLPSLPPTWTVAVDAFRHFPYVGSGLGTFPDAFRRAQPRELPGLIVRADSALLELLVTGGSAGVALAVIAALSLFVLFWRAWRSQRHREETAMTLAGLGALLFWALASLGGSATSSLTTLPALTAVCGMSWAASQARGVRLP
ncbi:MAG TPA: O-antigen ligase family protein [Thermoanaerobaculia bacterium]|nr:O-antigen ligase family protein [Thermoanaerobaculia bacterium]